MVPRRRQGGLVGRELLSGTPGRARSNKAALLAATSPQGGLKGRKPLSGTPGRRLVGAVRLRRTAAEQRSSI
eukprot:10585945-Heterocapsa_arctica.AAC.1